MLDNYKRWPKSTVLGQIISTPQLYKFYSTTVNLPRLRESLEQEGVIPELEMAAMFDKIMVVSTNSKEDSSRSTKLF